MTKGKQAALIEKLGEHMNESAGGLSIDDRFAGFIPSSTSNGEMQLDRILEDPDQPRKTFDEKALNELAQNLESHGIQQPIQLRWSEAHTKWLIVYGHRRYRAAKIAKLKSIPCTFADDNIDEPTLRVRQLVENCLRENLEAIEFANALKSLGELTGWSNQRMGQELGIDRTTIGRYLNLLGLADEVKEMVRTKQLAPSVAAEMVHIKDKAKQHQIGQDIADNKLNRQQAKQHIREAKDEVSEVRSTSNPQKAKELLCQTLNLTIHRNPNASNLQIQRELIAVAEQIEVERLES